MKDRISKFSQILESHFTIYERDIILQALFWAEKLHKGQTRASGEPYFIHPLKVAQVLTDFNMDYETIIAGLLHDILEDTDTTKDEIERKFGKTVAELVNGVTKISAINTETKMVQNSQTIRKTLFAMTEDIRVIIIKLADKFHNMSTLDYLPEKKRKRIATECLDIYAPLAQRLGISWLKAELEDLSLKQLNPTVYNHIVDNLKIRKNQRVDFLNKVKKSINSESKKENISIQIFTRAKHINSIYTKMKKQKKELDEMFDLNGVRIISHSINDCYSMLGICHSLWPPIEGRFKDYIAMPKANRYQSLHTTVMCFDGQLLEIQIRTEEMHARAEYGVAAHWAYKKGLNKNQIKPKELLIINTLKDWNSSQYNSINFLQDIKEELLKDSIYVFTPKGQIIELPKGATAIDFAYHIHTEVGNHCIGAKTDKAMIALNVALRNTEVIEILTSKNSNPNSNWLRIAKTTRAKTKIRQWLANNDNSIIINNSIIAQKESNDKNSNKKSEKTIKYDKEKESIIQNFFDDAKLKIQIGDEKNIMIQMAGCCQPVPGDDIKGYVSRGRGVIVHKKECKNLYNIPDAEGRLISVEWTVEKPKMTFRFGVLSKNVPDLFSQVDSAIQKQNGHLIQGRVEGNDIGNLQGSFSVELLKESDFNKIKKRVRNIPTILDIFSLPDKIK